MSTPSSTEPETPIVDDVSSQGGEVTVAPGAGKDPEVEVVDKRDVVDEGDVADDAFADDEFAVEEPGAGTPRCFP